MATTLSRMMKKAASSVIPLANRRNPYRNYFSEIQLRQVLRTTPIPTHQQFSSLAEKKSNSDDNFLRVIESEINDSAEEKFHEVAELPRDFPFRIECNAEEGVLILTREFEGEMIKVRVHTSLSPDYVDMDVRISKQSGITLKFDITVDSEDRFLYGGSVKADKIEINSMAIKNDNDPDDFRAGLEAPSSWELDPSVKTALHTYLEDRGIEPSYNKFLYEYYNSMVKKKSKKDTALLKNLKTFIAK